MRVTTWRRNASLRKPTEGSNMTAVTQRVVALKDLASLVNQRVGVSRWHRVTQEQVNLFAEATGDHQWIHVDPERPRASPDGTVRDDDRPWLPHVVPRADADRGRSRGDRSVPVGQLRYREGQVSHAGARRVPGADGGRSGRCPRDPRVGADHMAPHVRDRGRGQAGLRGRGFDEALLLVIVTLSGCELPGAPAEAALGSSAGPQ